MQPLKFKFSQPDDSCDGTQQSCIRTDDLEFVGDGSHLTYFEMLGNFSFGRYEYEHSVELWCHILSDLGITPSRFSNLHVRVHPSQHKHRRMWDERKLPVQETEDCVWSDGRIGGFCSEVFIGDLEIGNLVNTSGEFTDVGFGWERVVQVVENKSRIDQTSCFESQLHPVVSDHQRTLTVLWENGVEPGNKNRNYICRRLLRRLLRIDSRNSTWVFQEWLEQERTLLEESLKTGRRFWQRHKSKPAKFWWESFGILPEEIKYLSE